MGIAKEDMVEFNVEREEPTLVPPVEDTKEKGTLFFLSNYDLSFPIKVTTVYCYKPTDSNGNQEREVTEVIKDALSKVLVHYYPVAGRFTFNPEGRPSVLCTGEGAIFVEATADCAIENIGDDTVAMQKLIYEPPNANSIFDLPPLSVQVTTFEDGGFVLGICVNHMIFDGLTAMGFVKSWAEIARGLSLNVPPFLDRSILSARSPPKVEFPHHEFFEIEDVSNLAALYKEELVYKSFSFDHEKINKLKKAAMEDGILVKCSTFEALSAFIWSSRAQALKLSHDQQIKLLLVVDGRSKYDPPLPENYFGNGIAFTTCISTAGELNDKPLSFVVGLVREAIQMVTDNYMKSAIDYLEVAKLKGLSMTSTLVISSWIRLSFTTTSDFGWGRPFLVGPAFSPAPELALFRSNPKEMEGINVLLSLPASSMKIFEELMNV